MNENVDYQIYPNPSDGSFAIDLPFQEVTPTINLEIYNFDGKLIYSKTYERTNTIVLPDLLDKGIYQVKITTGNSVVTQKLMVK